MPQQIKKRTYALVLLAFFAVCAAVYAAPLESLMETLLVKTDKAGQEILEKTESALPGDIVEYRTTYNNAGNSTLTGLVVEVPIPANTQYLSGSAASKVPHTFMVSIDGGATWDHEPVRRMRKGSDGVEQEVIVGTEEYTHLRWIPKKAIQPGEVQVYRCRVKIS
ncbi:MAG: DUF11 domain-containing protein [Desulfatibacillum sp.]|nr:DUF11 domain-containing protein [Desulfatibacillum sp.]